MLHILGQGVKGKLRPLTHDVKTNRRIETENGKLYMVILSMKEEEEQEIFWEG